MGLRKGLLFRFKMLMRGTGRQVATEPSSNQATRNYKCDDLTDYHCCDGSDQPAPAFGATFLCNLPTKILLLSAWCASVCDGQWAVDGRTVDGGDDTMQAFTSPMLSDFRRASELDRLTGRQKKHQFR